MYTTTYFDDYQKQLNDLQQQFNTWQQRCFDTWLQNLPLSQAELNLTDTFTKALNLQEQLVQSCLEAQAKTSQMMLDSQRKFWNEYFQKLRQQAPASPQAKA